MTRILCLVTVALLTACLEDPTPAADPGEPAADATVDAAPDQSSPDLSTSSPPIDPELMDCDAIATCPPDSTRVDDCTGLAPDECFEVSVCGSVAYCEGCMPAPADEETCPNGTALVDTCPVDVECVTVTDTCGQDTINCAPLPCLCPEGTRTEECDPDDAGCFRIEACPAVTCALNCTAPDGCIEVEECRYDTDLYCEVVDQCGTACLDPTYCGPGSNPACSEGVYAPDCTADDPRCVATVGCNDQYWCRLPCPVETHRVPLCLAGDPLCWILEDGTACQSDGCRPMNPEEICLDWTPVDACESDGIPDMPEACMQRVLCGFDALCSGEVERACADGQVVCEAGYRSSVCRPDGQECRLSPSCNGLEVCVACGPDELGCGP